MREPVSSGEVKRVNGGNAATDSSTLATNCHKSLDMNNLSLPVYPPFFAFRAPDFAVRSFVVPSRILTML